MKIFTLLCVCTFILFAGKLTRSGNYVIDDKNKLMWQDTKENIKVLLTQEDANKYCENLNLGGFRDWKLPSVKNYKTIIEKKSKRSLLKINKLLNIQNEIITGQKIERGYETLENMDTMYTLKVELSIIKIERTQNMYDV